MNSVHVTPIRPHPIYPGVLKPKLINSSELWNVSTNDERFYRVLQFLLVV
jgi:hypothetical protein